jgi:hypothetical protein
VTDRTVNPGRRPARRLESGAEYRDILSGANAQGMPRAALCTATSAEDSTDESGDLFRGQHGTHRTDVTPMVGPIITRCSAVRAREAQLGPTCEPVLLGFLVPISGPFGDQSLEKVRVHHFSCPEVVTLGLP